MIFRIVFLLALIYSPLLWADSLTVEVTGVKKALLDNIENSLSINLADKENPPEASRIEWLHEQAETQIKIALQPFGYYAPVITSSLRQTAPGNWLAHYEVQQGKPTKYSEVQIKIEGEGANEKRFNWIMKNQPKKGEQLDHAKFEEFKERLRNVAAEFGYFSAEFSQSEIWVDLDRGTADIDLIFQTGNRYSYKKISFSGGIISQKLLRRYLKIHAGDPYANQDLLTLQSDLVMSDYFQDVTVSANPNDAEGEQIPVDVELTMQKKIGITAGIGYGTDTGVRLRNDIDWRYINRHGHKFSIETLLAEKKQNISLTYKIPGEKPQSDYWYIHQIFQREKTDVKDMEYMVFGGGYTSTDGSMTRTYGLDYRSERFEDPYFSSKRTTTDLLVPSAEWVWRSTKDPRFSRFGMRAGLQLRGGAESMLSDINFVQATVRGKMLIPVFSQGREKGSRFIVRGDAGATWVANDNDFHRLPPSLRFYAGGDNSVRGYSLDAIGPRACLSNATGGCSDKVIGGKYLLVGSVEYEQRIKKNWSVAAFVDMGDAFDRFNSFKPAFGVGVGVRWASPIGAVRVDLAHAFEDVGDDIRLHIGIGADL